MPKSDLTFEPGDYALVADRISMFYEQYPSGRIITELVSRTDVEVTFRAAVYREPVDREPAATGWASERQGDGDINLVACLENTETSAIGRALANLGFTASRRRPSREELEKADRARVRYGQRPIAVKVVRETRAVDAALQARADALVDVLRLLEPAQWVGMRKARAASIRIRLMNASLPAAALEHIARRLRNWIRRQTRPGSCQPRVSYP